VPQEVIDVRKRISFGIAVLSVGATLGLNSALADSPPTCGETDGSGCHAVDSGKNNPKFTAEARGQGGGATAETCTVTNPGDQTKPCP
jgi:hypothetical protein